MSEANVVHLHQHAHLPWRAVPGSAGIETTAFLVIFCLHDIGGLDTPRERHAGLLDHRIFS